MLSSMPVRDAGIAAGAAVALAAAFPKVGAAWLVPFGAAALFWLWQGASWKYAALLGWFAGIVFFALDFAWVGHTVGHYIGIFGPFLAMGPALIEAPFFALAGALAAVAYARMHPSVAPLGAAAAFTICEWLRSIGPLAAPFDQLGYTQAESPLRAVAAYAGTYGVTFALCAFGAYLADALRRRTFVPLAVAIATAGLASGAAWYAWPARTLPPPTIRVAAIQGNIAQSFKWSSLNVAVKRYTSMTKAASAGHPQLDRLARDGDHHAARHVAITARTLQGSGAHDSRDDRRRQPGGRPRCDSTTRCTYSRPTARSRSIRSGSSYRLPNGFPDGPFSRGCPTSVRSTAA